MTRFSESKRGSSKTLNYEGAPAYTDSPEMALYGATVTSTLNPRFYEPSSSDYITKIRTLIPKVTPLFILKLAIYARSKMYMRSSPLVLLVEYIKYCNDNGIDVHPLTSRAIIATIQRADELYEILGYYKQANGIKDGITKLSHALRKGVANAFHKFDEYQFAKYNRPVYPGLRDAMFLTHPSPQPLKYGQDGKAHLFRKIADDDLKTPYTWETQLSERGNTAEVWAELIESDKLPYMALLRNLRNILKAETPYHHLTLVGKMLTDLERVKRSRQFPFRFLSAYRELKAEPYTGARVLLDALEEAFNMSSANIPIADDEAVVIACDTSGSMQTPISPRSKIQQFDIGLVLGMALSLRLPNCITGMFGDHWIPIQFSSHALLEAADEMHRREGEAGYSTYGHKVLDWITRNGKAVDKVFFFTDSQMYGYRGLYSMHRGDVNTTLESWKAVKHVNPGAKLYFFDLSGYGDTPISTLDKDVWKISGWSDKVFDVLARIDKGGDALDAIKETEIG